MRVEEFLYKFICLSCNITLFVVVLVGENENEDSRFSARGNATCNTKLEVANTSE